MADYLGQLVHRVRQPDDAIQPRLSSRFEAPWPAKVEAPSSGCPSDESRRSGPSQPRRRLTAAESYRAHEPIGRIGSGAAALPARCRLTRERASDQRRRPEEPAALTRGATGGRAHGPPEDATQSRGRRRSTCLSERRIRARLTSPRPSAPGERSNRPRSCVRARAGTSCPFHPKGASRSRSQPTASRTGARRTIPALPNRCERETIGAAQSDGLKRARRRRSSKWSERRARGLATFSSRPTEPPDAERSAGPDAPTIHVTIGRVEIRASVAAPVTRKPQVRPPAMSLEEYLKQRKGATRE